VAAVCVIIVNYRTPALTVDCLRSLEAEVRTIGACRVVVVDNASPDDSAAVIAQAIADNNWGGWAEFRPLEKNLGFAAGNNAVLQRELDSNPPDFFWLLNPDTVVRPGSLRPLLDYLQSHPHVGIVGSRLEDPDGTPQRSAFRFLTPASEFEQSTRFGITTWLLRPWQMAPPVRETPHPTDWVAGASMLVRREVFETAGLMDDRYFLYFEEVDFCLAARRAGWRCWYVPESRVVHLVGQSSGVTDTRAAPKPLPPYWFDSRRRYFRKNYGKLYSFSADLAWAIGWSLWRLRRRLQRKPDNDPPGLLVDFVRYNFLGLPLIR
jgi:GT2 family glycosyltransferase